MSKVNHFRDLLVEAIAYVCHLEVVAIGVLPSCSSSFPVSIIDVDLFGHIKCHHIYDMCVPYGTSRSLLPNRYVSTKLTTTESMLCMDRNPCGDYV